MSDAPIYLDHNSTTPIDPRVVEAMTRAWRDGGANPASQHGPGRRARRTLEEAREGIAGLLGAKTGGMDADRVIFTSGGTEANNLAILGLADLPVDRVLTSGIEHPSVQAATRPWQRFAHYPFVDPSSPRAKYLRNPGVEAIVQFWLSRARIAELPVSPNGVVSVERQGNFEADFQLVSLMLANNETGVIQPIRALADLAHRARAPMHTDAVQAIGKIPVNFRDLGVDAMTVAPHKFHGPLGIGALVVRHGIKVQPLLQGGFQQEGLRPGTENVALAVGFHEALKLATAELPERAERMRLLRDDLEQRLTEFGRLEDCPTVVIGQGSPRLPNTSCIAFPGIDRQALVMALDMAGIACSTGSACASGSSEPSPTLVAMGLSQEVISGAIRLSLGAFTTAEEVAEAARRIIKAVKHLRSRKSS
jgi:cysteine desulfurase